MPKLTPLKPKAPPPKISSLFKDYFINSDEKLLAWLLLIGAAVCVIALVVVMATIAWWTAGFWALIVAKAGLTPFLYSVGEFALLAGAYVGAAVLKNFFIGKLAIRWRNWLTKKVIKELFKSENNYLELKRFSTVIENIAQRVQEDIKNFVELTLSVGADLLKSICSLVAFTGSLWIVGGPLAFTLLGLSVVIPGYLVWVALAVAMVATAITFGLGKALPKVTKKSETAEANFRQDLSQLNLEAENIAQEHAEKYYKTSLASKVQAVKKTANKKLNLETIIIAFQNFYFQIANVLPIICAAPLYFSGLIQIGQLMQVSLAFMEVSVALSLFVGSYQNIASCKASIERIIQLKTALQKKGLPLANDKAIVRKEREKDWIKIKNLDIMPPQLAPSSVNYIMRGLNIKLIPGEHILMKGPSGLGKSTLFKVISGIWKYGTGKVALPANKSFYFLPQRPVLPNDTLRAVLAYGEPVDTYTTKQYVTALRLVRLNRLIPMLDEVHPWSHQLSGGEQQRLSFARALLKKPDWLFLDEATSSLDEPSENYIYRMLKATLKDTTIISIGHRSTIEKHHSKTVFFKVGKNKEIKLSDKKVTPTEEQRLAFKA